MGCHLWDHTELDTMKRLSSSSSYNETLRCLDPEAPKQDPSSGNILLQKLACYLVAYSSFPPRIEICLQRRYNRSGLVDFRESAYKFPFC